MWGYGLDAIPYRASQLWKQVPTDIREAASLTLFKNCIRTWKCEDCPCRSCKLEKKNTSIRYIKFVNKNPVKTVKHSTLG